MDGGKTVSIPDSNADTTTLTVVVQNSATASTQTTYNLATDITQVTDSTNAYFLQEIMKLNFSEYNFTNNINLIIDREVDSYLPNEINYLYWESFFFIWFSQLLFIYRFSKYQTFL